MARTDHSPILYAGEFLCGDYISKDIYVLSAGLKSPLRPSRRPYNVIVPV